MLGSVNSEKGENPKGKGKLENGKNEELIKLIRLGVIIINLPF